MSSYKGEVIAEIEGVQVRQLTADERRHAGHDYYVVSGITHWSLPAHFLTSAEEHERIARVLRAAHAVIASPARQTKPTEEQS